MRAGSGPPVVLVHGLGLGADVWSYHADRIAAAGFRVLAPDLPGFGRTSGPTLGFGVDRAAHWLLAFAEREAIDRAVWVGHSVSAQHVLRLCALQPRRVAGLVLAAPTGEPGAFRWLAQLLGLARAAFREPPPLVASVLRHYLTTPPLRIVGTWLAARRHDVLADVRLARCPLRVVLGSRDTVVPVAFARHLAESAARGDIVLIPGSGHGVALDPPQPFCQALLAFLRDCPADAAGWTAPRASDRAS